MFDSISGQRHHVTGQVCRAFCEWLDQLVHARALSRRAWKRGYLGALCWCEVVFGNACNQVIGEIEIQIRSVQRGGDERSDGSNAVSSERNLEY